MLLAFDTATPHVTVALHDPSAGPGTGAVVASYSSGEGDGARGKLRHGEMLAPGIDAVLAEAGAAVADLTGIAVGVGPGPFTGLRVGLVTARTMALARGIPVYGVCTLDVLAAAALDAGLEEFTVATDARRKEVYLATYVGGARTSGPVVVRPADAATDAPVVGRGAVMYPDAFPDARPPEHPDAAVLCDLVVRQRFPLLEPEPLYLRRPDAMAPHAPKRVS